MKRLGIGEQLAAAAWRILNDDNQHAPEAVLWAESVLGRRHWIEQAGDTANVQTLQRAGFTLHEISLGAWAS